MFEERARALLAQRDIEINGVRPWDIRIHNKNIYRRALLGGSLALGESYMDGWWDCAALDEFFNRLLRVPLGGEARAGFKTKLLSIANTVTNRQSVWRSRIVGETHYDLGNTLYRAMLDSRLNYSCGYYGRGAETLEEAQRDKLQLICDKLHLKGGERILEIGCGWGAFANYAAQRYGARVVGLTISAEQAALAAERCADLPVRIELVDYRNVGGLGEPPFDRIVSIGMFEHVGPKNYRDFMRIAADNLRDDGLFLLHTIVGSGGAPDAWLDKYIFPGGVLPSPAQMEKSAEGIFMCKDGHSFGPDYDRTLLAWHKNFLAHWDVLKDTYDDRFKRMWEYYLLSCAGAFRAEVTGLQQLVLARPGYRENYEPAR